MLVLDSDIQCSKSSLETNETLLLYISIVLAIISPHDISAAFEGCHVKRGHVILAPPLVQIAFPSYTVSYTGHVVTLHRFDQVYAQLIPKKRIEDIWGQY